MKHPSKHAPHWRLLGSSFVKEFALLLFIGLFVAVAMLPLLELEPVRQLDLSFNDLLMRQLAEEQLFHPPAAAARYVFVDIGDRTCRDWAQSEHANCTASLNISRKKLATLINAMATAANKKAARPLLTVIDIELSPLPPPGNSDDTALCAATVRLSRYVPVIALRPLVVNSEAAGLSIAGYPSILDAALQPAGCGDGGTARDIAFASPLVEADFDGVVRSVHASDRVRMSDGKTVVIPGVGLLGGTLLQRGTRNPLPANAGVSPNGINRISFRLPYGAYGMKGIHDYGYAPSVIESVEAEDVETRLHDAPNLLGNAVVMIGGSYAASDDLYQTPLNARFPGVMIHANAIDAYARGTLLQEKHRWSIELLLITAAALVGAAFHVWGHTLSHRFARPWSELSEMAAAIVGGLCAVGVIFIVSIEISFDQLARTGTLIGAVTPACFVALESFSTVLQNIRQLIHHDEKAPAVHPKPLHRPKPRKKKSKH